METTPKRRNPPNPGYRPPGPAKPTKTLKTPEYRAQMKAQQNASARAKAAGSRSSRNYAGRPTAKQKGTR